MPSLALASHSLLAEHSRSCRPGSQVFGLVFATQAPRGLHNRIVGNATTQFYGFMNAPAQISAVREIAAVKGGDVPDISRLKPGLFYIASDAIALQKITTPICLSYHPRSPLTAMEVLDMASAR